MCLNLTVMDGVVLAVGGQPNRFTGLCDLFSSYLENLVPVSCVDKREQPDQTRIRFRLFLRCTLLWRWSEKNGLISLISNSFNYSRRFISRQFFFWQTVNLPIVHVTLFYNNYDTLLEYLMPIYFELFRKTYF